MEYITERDAIRNLQRYLRQLYYADPSIPPVPIDGIYDTATRDALIKFQQEQGLYPSGVADKETWDRLYAEYLASIDFHSAPELLPLFPRVPNDYSLALGDEYFLVSIVQFLLNELRMIYDSFIPLVINGIYDEATEANIREFQKKNRLPQTGRTDKATWNKLVGAYRNYAADYIR